MTLLEWGYLIGDLIIVSGLLPLAIFMLRYYQRSPWDQTELGVALMFQKAGFLVVIVVLSGSYFLGPDYPGRWLVRIIAFGLVVFGFWVDIVNLRRYQRRYPVNMKAYQRKSLRQILRMSLRPHE